jgi:hypothetical protein
LRPRRSDWSLSWRSHIENERAGVLFSIAPDDRQKVRAIWNGGGEKHNDLCVSRADHRHQIVLAPDLWRLLPEANALNGQRLVRAIDSGAQDDKLISGRDRFCLLLGVGKLRPQQHDQKHQHQRAD